MIFVTGDCHGDCSRLGRKTFRIGKELTKSDYIIILGDFGLIFDYHGESAEEKFWLNWLEEQPWTTLFIDGNHENFDRLNQYPVEEWNGGKVHFIRPSVIHLMRGEIFDIDGNSFLAMGGAASHDIKDGILEPDDPNYKEKYRRMIKDPFCLFRVNHRSWWKEEIPSAEERSNALKNLADRNFKVDYILSHEAPASDVALVGRGLFKPDEYSTFLENEIRAKTEYKHWFFGHYHIDHRVNEKETFMYESINYLCY